MQHIQSTANGAKKPLVSFIIPCFNLPHAMLLECVESVLALSLSRDEREIIIVDDGSDESPLAELSDFIDDITYTRQPNAGLSAARNTGISLAHGQYLQFVDGDDKLIPAAYDLCLDIVRNENPDIVMFQTAADDSPTSAESQPMLTDGTTFMSNNNLRAAAWGYVFSRKTLGELRFTPGLLHEDEEFTPLLLLRAERLFVTQHGAYYYRQREGSITTSRKRRNTLRRLSDYERIIKRLRDVSNTLPRHESSAMERRIAQLTMDYIYNIITLTRSKSQLHARIERLAKAGLYPLPRRPYTSKYAIFSRLANSKIGLALMLRLLH